MNMSAEWVYDALHQVYYNPASATYAIPDIVTGQWSYAPASTFHKPQAESSAMAQRTMAEREDGEVDDNVGWGGLMEPEQVEAAIKAKTTLRSKVNVEKHPAYNDSRRSPQSRATATPDHILRLVVVESEVLPQGHVAVIDAREGGIQLGRDRCEKGGSARIRLKELEVSKTHSVVYWGMGAEDGEEGWWVVDLGGSVLQQI
jgi:hypothetical protein